MRIMNENEPGYYYDLFKFFSEEHGLILLDSEIQDIIRKVEEFKKEDFGTKLLNKD